MIWAKVKAVVFVDHYGSTLGVESGDDSVGCKRPNGDERVLDAVDREGVLEVHVR
jgi:hypothetical protein